MKNLHYIAVLSAIALIQSEGFAQASFYLRNHDTMAGVDAPVYDGTGALLAGVGWRAELYGGVSADSLSPIWDISKQRREIVPVAAPGFFTSIEGPLCVLSVRGGGWAWLQLRVWNVAVGSTYEAAVARDVGGFGQSAVFQARGGDPSVPTLPGPLIGLTSFSVSQVVPEPAVGWLLLAGLPALWWCQRKRR